MATNVPTNGFIAPPEVPQMNAPAQPQVRLPGEDSHQYANQVPGMVPNPGTFQSSNNPAPAQVPALDAATITSIITNALASQGQPVAPQNVGAQPDAAQALPTWIPDTINTFDVESIQDPIIKSMASILQSSGKDLDLNRVLGNALTHGDASLIDRAYLAEKGGANAQQLAQLAQGIVQAVNAKSEAITTGVHALVGGEANWNQASAVFNSGAPQELKVVVATMLNSTNESQINAAAKIVAEFGRTSGHLPQAGAALLNSTAAGAQGQGLSKEQFQAELSKLKPDTRAYESEREALFARRSQGKRVGL